MKKMRDVVMISNSRWDDAFSSTAFCLAKEFAQESRVFYIDHPFTIKDLKELPAGSQTIKSRLSALIFGKDEYHVLEGFANNLTIVTPRLVLPINWLPEGTIYNYLANINDNIVYTVLRKAVKQFHIKDYILFNCFDPFYLKNIPSDIKPTISIYQTVDDISQETYIARHGVRLEREALAKADISLATSRELTRKISLFSKKPFCLPNAADFSLFQIAATEELKKPQELLGCTQKVICYTGNIGTRINYGLLHKIAVHHPDKLLVLVGPLSTNSYKEFGLDRLANVVLTGAKGITELPAYLQYSDCLIIPFEYSLLTKSIYPLKINEYLAAGKPIVTTAFSEDIEDFSDVAYVAMTDDEFIEKINLSITENTSEKTRRRVEKSAHNTWKNRVAQFWDIIASVDSKF